MALLGLIILLSVLVIAVSILYTKQKMRYSIYSQKKHSDVASKKSSDKIDLRKDHTKKGIPLKKSVSKQAYRVAIIIDDLGYNNHKADELLKIDAKLTFSVFPLSPHSKSIAEKANAMGKEVMLHLPMEPYKYPEKNPGNGTLLLSMSDEELEEILVRDIQSVPFIKGINNHMGSRFTEDHRKMMIVLKKLEKKGLFFLDSLTTSDSVGYKLAKEIGLDTAARDIFLDNEKDFEYISAQVDKLIKISKRRGYAIGIGHPYPSTIDALKRLIPGLEAKGIEVVPISHLVN
ncbi:MAG: divergent polysaccharide deacetylase family protein [Thermodesulfobacteriota bacterium]|nr:divergent polysaccharide deacetylase family protein [Thermodesulfobacteriota bacterium]